MKKYLFLFVALLLVANVFAANTDRYYQGTVTKTETFTSIVYTWTYTVPTEATDQMHSPAIKISDCNDNDGLITAVANAISDNNIVLHFGNGTTWFTAVTPAGLDATSSTTKQDTIGTQNGATDYAFRTGTWLIIEGDYGSSACEAGEIVTVQVALRKDKYFIDSAGRMVSAGEIRNQRSSGWTNP